MRIVALAAAAALLAACPSVGATQDIDLSVDLDASEPLPEIGSGLVPPEEIERIQAIAAEYFPDDDARRRAHIARALTRLEQDARHVQAGLERPRTIVRGYRGRTVNLGDAAFQVQLRFAPSVTFRNNPGRLQPWEMRHICGGTLIDAEWVLTAAHCLKHWRDGGIEAVVGTTDISSGEGQVLRADRYVRHGRYSANNIYDHDIALVHLARRPGDKLPEGVQQATLDEVRLARRQQSVDVMYVNGWGKAGDAMKPVAVLRQFMMRKMSDAECEAQVENYPGVNKFHERVVCAGGVAAKICEGDSGGPLYYRSSNAAVVVGVVAWNRGKCGRADLDKPGVYTKVSAYRGWIDRAKRARGNTAD